MPPQHHGDASPAVHPPSDVELQTTLRPRNARSPTILILFLVAVAVVGVFLFVFVFIGVDVRSPHIYVSNAFLTSFTASNSTRFFDFQYYDLHFNLTVDIGLRNTNRWHRLCYRELETGAYYGVGTLAQVSLPGFCQSSKMSNTVTVVFAGNATVDEFAVATGSYALRVDVQGAMKARLEILGWSYNRDVDNRCEIEVPLVENGRPTNSGFSPVDCEDVSPSPNPSPVNRMGCQLTRTKV